MGVGNPDRNMGAEVPKGYRLVAIKRVSEHVDDDHLSVVLAKNVERTEWVTWIHNRNTNGCADGHYFLHQIMLDGDNLRETERRAWQDFVDRGHQPDLQLELRDISERKSVVKSQDEIDNTVANVRVQIWSDDQDKWLDYSRVTWVDADRFKQTLLHSGGPTRLYRAIADFGDGEVLWNMKD